MIAFLDGNRERFGVEPICEVLEIAPSTYCSAKKRPPVPASPARREAQGRHPSGVRSQLRRLRARKEWRQLNREGVVVARCTVERLMAQMGLQGRVRGKEAAHDDPR